MTRFGLRLARATRGAAAVEFALAIPALLVAIIGLAQLGILFFANAGLNSALDEGARYATTFDPTTNQRPTNSQITAFIKSHEYGMDSSKVNDPTYASGTSNGAKYLEITLSYQVSLNFVFFHTSPVTLSKTRRVYVF